MSRAIILRSISGEEDKRFVLGNAQKARLLDLTPAFANPTDWTTIRIGVRESMTDSGANIAGTPRLYIGMMSSPLQTDLANGPLGSSTDHFVGIVPVGTTATRNTGPPVTYTFGGNRVHIKIGSTLSNPTSTINLNKIVGLDTERRIVSLIQITKGSPSWTMQMVACSNTNPGDISKSVFLDSVATAGMSNAEAILEAASGGAHYTTSGVASFAVDEATNGFLDSICLGWDREVSLYHFSDAYYSVFA